MSHGETVLADLHSHLVPGVDDGARTGDDTVEGIERMVERGYRRIVTTPHLDASLTLDPRTFAVRMDEIREGWNWIVGRVRQRWPELDFRQGHEVMLDVPDGDFSDERLRLGGTRFILVEWARMQVPPQSQQVLSRLRFAGLRPIIAHPERYFGLDPELAVVAEWKDAGAYLQVNTGSLAGRYGGRARSVAVRLLRRGWVDYLSTDFHGRPHLSLYCDEAEEALAELGGDDHFSLLAGANPCRVFDDEEPMPVPPLPDERGLLERLRGLFGGSED